MIEVIPTILVKSFDEAKEKIKKVEPYVQWVQLDVMDGQFVNNVTWNNPEDLKNLETKLNLEAHLMINKPEEVIDSWIESGVKRIIFHVESSNQTGDLIKKIKGAGLGAGLALNPETPIEVVNEFIQDLDLILIMTVNPGFGGQEFLKESLGKVKRLRDKYPDVKIGVDGGISLETAPGIISSGANILSVGSAVFKSDNIEQAIKQLKGE